MKGRPDTDLALARGGAAYAVLSNGAFGAPCAQDVELLSASGNSCARWTLELSFGAAGHRDTPRAPDSSVTQRSLCTWALESVHRAQEFSASPRGARRPGRTGRRRLRSKGTA